MRISFIGLQLDRLRGDVHLLTRLPYLQFEIDAGERIRSNRDIVLLQLAKPGLAAQVSTPRHKQRLRKAFRCIAALIAEANIPHLIEVQQKSTARLLRPYLGT